jgi:uncharacterized membrane protein YtjA (UPF0391 family)
VKRAALIYFILAIVTFILGLAGIAGMNVEIGKTFFSVFLFLSVVSFLVAVTTNENIRGLP